MRQPSQAGQRRWFVAAPRPRGDWALPADPRGRSLYICYFGIREPLVQTQVVPYLKRLAAAGFEVFLLTFEPFPPSRWEGASPKDLEIELTNQGIRWYSLPYHKRPSLPATLYDIARGASLGSR